MSSWKKKGFGIFVIGETALFFGAWYCYHKMNTSIGKNYDSPKFLDTLTIAVIAI